VSGFGHETIAGSLFAHWAANFPLSVTTIYPGIQADTAGEEEWLEVWINSWRRNPRRTENLEQTVISVSAHAFVERSLDKGRVLELADAVKTTLEHQQVSVTDPSQSGTPVVGHVQLWESQSRVFTRLDHEAGRPHLQHVVVTTLGICTEIA